jgi:threonine dehydratase
LDVVKEALEAEGRIKEYIRETPLEYSPYLSKLGSCSVYLKLESLQVTGSFKYRGAANHILSLSQKEKERGIVTASTGNHGAACACVLGMTGIKGTIYLPETATGAKLEALKSYGVELKFQGTDCIETETFARQTAAANGQVYIPPYNHPKIIGGQATIAIELQRQLETVDAVFVPIGGGGLVSGIAGYLKARDPSIKTIGCQPTNSAVMYESVRQGRVVDIQSLPTLSDGTAGGIEKDSITFDICRRYVDDYVLISEDEIRDALLLITEKHHMLIEGAAALSVASFIKAEDRLEGKNVVLLLSGNKLSMETLKSILDTD